MTIISEIPASGDAYAQLVHGLRKTLGCDEIALLAERIFDAERVDFLWQARVRVRYLGQHWALDLGDEEGADELSRMAVLSSVGERWHAGVCLVDGEGCAVDIVWSRSFDHAEEAMDMFVRAR